MTPMLAQSALVNSRLLLAVTVLTKGTQQLPKTPQSRSGCPSSQGMGVALSHISANARFDSRQQCRHRAHVEPEQPDAEDRSIGVGPATGSPMGRPSVMALVTPSWLHRYI